MKAWPLLLVAAACARDARPAADTSEHQPTDRALDRALDPALARAIAACGGRATELFGADLELGSHDERPGIALRVYTTGAWTRVTDEPYRLEHGCLARGDIERIERALDRATWMRVASPGATCKGPAPSAMYFANGRTVAEMYSCESVLDDTTRTAIQEIDAIMRAARAAGRQG